MEVFLAICLGVGLSAACGFRIFLPALLAGIGHHYGVAVLESLPPWLGSTPALAALTVASALEIGAYYIPWLDNLLDAIASPVAVLAGILLFFATNSGLDPFWRWSLAVAAGGGAASVTQTATVLTRTLSTGVSGGVANPLVSTAEWILAIATSLLSFLFAPLALVLLVLALWRLVHVIRHRRHLRTNGGATSA